MNQNRSNRFLQVLGWMAVIGLIITLYFLVFTRIDKLLRIKAIDDCAKSSKFEKTIVDENTKVSYPVLDIYKNCIKDKGF